MGRQLGLISDARYAQFTAKKAAIVAEKARLENTRLKPKDVADFLEAHHMPALKDGVLASDFLKRPEVTYADLMTIIPAETPVDRYVAEEVEVQIKYAGYIDKEMQSIAKLKRMEAKKIPANIDYEAISGLATEARQKLTKIQPETLAQASRISGVNPADAAILSVYIEQGKIAKVHA
jgi:tRNA uridine 5-carboxymethylaminomethyl modification enzyme